MGLQTTWSTSIGIATPIVNAPMGGAAGGRLAAAVSRAGGLGMVGMGSTGSAERLAAELRHVEGLGAPYGIGLVDWVMRAAPGLLETAIAAAPTLLSVSFGEDLSWIPTAQAAGILTATQVATVEAARRAVDAGVDVLVARGSEGGGHGEPVVGTLPLLAAVLDRVERPVLAAGGIASARGVAAVLAAGAAGAWVGTLFATCPEALTGDGSRAAILAAQETDTRVTSVFDRARAYDWPARFPERALGNDFLGEWEGRPAELLADPTALERFRAGADRDDPAYACVDAGQGVGSITAVRSAAEVVADLTDGAARLLGRWA